MPNAPKKNTWTHPWNHPGIKEIYFPPFHIKFIYNSKERHNPNGALMYIFKSLPLENTTRKPKLLPKTKYNFTILSFKKKNPFQNRVLNQVTMQAWVHKRSERARSNKFCSLQPSFNSMKCKRESSDVHSYRFQSEACLAMLEIEGWDQNSKKHKKMNVTRKSCTYIKIRAAFFATVYIFFWIRVGSESIMISNLINLNCRDFLNCITITAVLIPI